MDESWRMRMGMPSTIPDTLRRNSTDDTSRRNVFSDSETLHPEDFNDVFGGPPRSVLSRRFSTDDFSRPTFSYEEIFQQPRKNVAPERNVRNLPEFRIPSNRGCRKYSEEEFYGDIFGDLWRSKSRSQSYTNSISISNSNSKSKSNSSSVLSSEDLSPFRSAVADDDVSFFASKLRPINVSSKWNSSAMMHEVRPMAEAMPDFQSMHSSYFENQFSESEQRENFRASLSGCSRKVTSPETISHEPNSYRRVKVSVDDLPFNSASSVVSSFFHYHETEASRIVDQENPEQSMEQEDEDEFEDEDEVMSSYVIEINLDNWEETGEEALGIDEAIAWAKEKCRAPSPKKDWSTEKHEQEEDPTERLTANHVEGQIGGCGSTQSHLHKKPKEFATEEENPQLERDMELELLDEDVRLWSAGKEANIRLLLSTLHHIMWPNSGWYSIPSSNLKESADVKKAYQKARLCLHPDKLQQRGANFPQKYVAEKAFPILQDAWASFISHDVFYQGRKHDLRLFHA